MKAISWIWLLAGIYSCFCLGHSIVLPPEKLIPAIEFFAKGMVACMLATILVFSKEIKVQNNE